MKRTLVLFLLAAAALSAACSDDGNTAPEGQGRLRIVHVSPDAPNLDVVLDGDTVASDIAYLGSSDYLELSAAGHVMQISETNTSTTLIDQDVTVADGVDYYGDRGRHAERHQGAGADRQQRHSSRGNDPGPGRARGTRPRGRWTST